MAKSTTKKVDQPDIKPVEVMRSVQIFYTDDELMKMGKQVASNLGDIENLKNEAKEKASNYKNSIVAKETTVTTLRNSINQGYQMVMKKCKLVKNFENQKREYWLDGNVVEEEPLTKEDYQTELDLVDAKNAAEEKRLLEIDSKKTEGATGKLEVVKSDATEKTDESKA